MKKLFIALLIITPSVVHGCSGPGAYSTKMDNTAKPRYPRPPSPTLPPLPRYSSPQASSSSSSSVNVTSGSVVSSSSGVAK
jgi:hypothetical protein